MVEPVTEPGTSHHIDLTKKLVFKTLVTPD